MSIRLSRPPNWGLIPKELPSNCSPHPLLPPSTPAHTLASPRQLHLHTHPQAKLGVGGSDGANYPWVIIIQLIITGPISGDLKSCRR